MPTLILFSAGLNQMKSLLFNCLGPTKKWQFHIVHLNIYKCLCLVAWETDNLFAMGEEVCLFVCLFNFII